MKIGKKYKEAINSEYYDDVYVNNDINNYLKYYCEKMKNNIVEKNDYYANIFYIYCVIIIKSHGTVLVFKHCSYALKL